MEKLRQKENLQKCLIKYIGNFVSIKENVRKSLTVRNENVFLKSQFAFQRTFFFFYSGLIVGVSPIVIIIY